VKRSIETSSKPGLPCRGNQLTCNVERDNGRKTPDGVFHSWWLAGFVDGRLVRVLAQLLRLVLLAASLAGAQAFAGPQIDIGFEAGAAGEQKLIHASAVFPAGRNVVYSIFDAINDYPMLHEWIHQTTRIGGGDDSEVYQVEFDFPWPVGRQWSRVEVRHSGNAIVWRQTDGSIKANHGRIEFIAQGDTVKIDYLAAIDIGLPEVLTQPYKKQFVTEFLFAARKQAGRMESAPPLALADGS
jgi:hypothetical protein